MRFKLWDLFLFCGSFSVAEAPEGVQAWGSARGLAYHWYGRNAGACLFKLVQLQAHNSEVSPCPRKELGKAMCARSSRILSAGECHSRIDSLTKGACLKARQETQRQTNKLKFSLEIN